jgi:PAS domain S-box-containing protein
MDQINSIIRFKTNAATFYTSSLDLTCISGYDGYFKQIDSAFEHILGYPVSDLLAKSFIEFVHPEDREQTLAELAKLQKGQITLYFENRYQCQDGSYRWFMWSAYPDHDNQLIYAVAQNITAQKQSLTKKIDTPNIDLTTSVVAIIVSNEMGYITTANRIAEALFGYSTDELVGMSIEQLVPESRRKIHLQHQESYLTRPHSRPMGTDVEVYGLRKNGTIFPAKVALNSTITNGKRVVISFMLDMTRQKLDEEHWHDQFMWSETIKDTLATLTSILNLKEVLEQIIVHLSSIISFDNATVLSLENNKFREVLRRGNILHGNSLTPFLVQSQDDIDRALNSDEWVRLNNESAGCHIYSTPLIDGERIIITLLAHKQIIGLVSLDRLSNNLDPFTQLEIERIGILTQYASIAVANAQVYETLQNNLEDQKKLEHATTFIMSARSQNELAQQVIDAVVEDFDQLDCGIFLKKDLLTDDGKKQTWLERVARTGKYKVDFDTPMYYDDPGVVPYAVRQIEVIYVPDVVQNEYYVANKSDTQSELVIPLNTCFGVIGALDLQSPKIDAFSSRDRKILGSFAERAALSFENMYLLEVTQNFAADLEQSVIDRTHELSEEKSQIEAILQNIDQVIMLVDTTGMIQRANPSFLRYFDYDIIYNVSITDLVLDEMKHQVLDALALVTQTKKPTHFALTCKRRDGSSFAGDFALSPIGRYNNVSTIVCTLSDITQHKTIEKSLRDALDKEQELNELKTAFIAMTSHEFRTPLATIQASFDLLRRYENRMSADDKKKRFDKIERTIEHMTLILEDILSISRIDAGTVDFNPIATDIKKFVSDLIEDFKLQPNCQHDIIFEHSGNDYEYDIDRKLMQKIVTNLLSNAVKYSPHSTKITTYIECDATNFMLTVTDEGIGIPTDDQSHLFETFHRASNVGTTPGTGLGLKVVQQSVDLHRGHISFTSAINKGSTFTIIIPDKESNQ